MFLSLTDIKINNDYTYLKSTAPAVTDDSAAGFSVGETWLDLSTGFSYQSTDVSVGAAVWPQIELNEDAKINRDADNTFLSFLKIINNNFIVSRNEPFENLDQGFPNNSKFNRESGFKLEETESLYSKFIFDSATKTITAGADIYGDITQFAANDMILIEGTRRNDGYYTLASVTATTLVINETLTDGEAYGFISLVIIPAGFTKIMGRVVHYDIYNENTTGFQSEKIGSYGYTLQDLSGAGYPDDIVRGLSAYEGIIVGGSAFYVD